MALFPEKYQTSEQYHRENRSCQDSQLQIVPGSAGHHARR